LEARPNTAIVSPRAGMSLVERKRTGAVPPPLLNVLQLTDTLHRDIGPGRAKSSLLEEIDDTVRDWILVCAHGPNVRRSLPTELLCYAPWWRRTTGTTSGHEDRESPLLRVSERSIRRRSVYWKGRDGELVLTWWSVPVMTVSATTPLGTGSRPPSGYSGKAAASAPTWSNHCVVWVRPFGRHTVPPQLPRQALPPDCYV